MAGHDFDDGSERTVIAERVSAADPTGRAEEPYMLVIAGPNAGEMFKVGVGGDVGRGADAEFHLTDTEISRRHARIRRAGDDVFVEDLNSTNGTFVNGEPVRVRKLSDGDKIQVGTTTILKFGYQDDLEEQFQRKMFESALRDGLTKAFNKKYFEERLESEVAFALRHGTALSLLILDLDHFKRINDTFGHLAGDYVLSTFAGSIMASVRKEDLFARYGGEEFVLISRGLDEEAVRLFGERVRRSVELYPFRYEDRDIPVTVSIGIAALPSAPAQDGRGLVAMADKALYAAKNGGRNRLCVYGDAA